MNKRATTLRRATAHLLALLAGAGLAAWWGSSRAGGPAAGTAAAANGGARPGSGKDADYSNSIPAASKRTATRSSTDRSAAYREAWAALLLKNLPTEEMKELQNRLLREWVEIDPEGAVAAALGVMGASGSHGTNSGILDAFYRKMADQPGLFWPMIRDNKFGMATAHLRNQWIEVVGQRDPALLASYFDELPPQARTKAVTACLQGLHKSPEKMKAFLDKMTALPDTPENRGMWKSAGSYLGRLTAEELVKGLTDAANEGQRQIYLEGYAQGWSNKQAKPGELRAALETLPEASRKDAALAVLGKTYYAASITDVADLLIEQGDWAAVSKSLVVRLHQSATQDTGALAAWAATLPERQETEDLYRTAVRQHINGDPEAARDWIEAMPAGWKRDNALAEYVNSSLHARDDPDGAAWAFERIESTTFIKAAEVMQQQWQDRKKP